MLNLNSVLIGTTKPEAMAAFYAKVLGRPADMIDAENGVTGWMVGSAFLAVLKHSQMQGDAQDPGRVMFNFETADVQAEFERITSVGGEPVRPPYSIGDGWVATLADPDGNFFQLMSPMPMEAEPPARSAGMTS